MRVFWSTCDWADAVAALPVDGPLPCRTVLVPRERVAHALRRELLRLGRPDALAGTRFVHPVAAAVEVLRLAGIAFTPGEEALRPARLLALFRRGLALEHFSLDLLRTRPGWDQAFARTIGDLEGAGLRHDDLTVREPSARLRDVATVWRALDESAARSWTTSRVFLEAASVLEERPASWPHFGATLATAAGHVTAAQARFFCAIPAVSIALLAGRPLRARHLERMRALFGEPAAEALLSSRAPRSTGSERDLLASYLFEPPAVLGDPARQRSTGPDGTVDLEEHAGVEAEVEATADWVARQVLDGAPLEEIAVLVPALDPLAGLVAERLARLPWHDGALPVHVAGGLPLAGTAAGARVLAVVRALRAHLSGDALAEVLPSLRSIEPDGRHLSHGRAMDLVWSLGTAGGNPAHPEGALDWAMRAARREPDLAAHLERARAADDDPERSGLARTARDLERLLGDLRAVRPAIEALVGVARLVVDGAGLAEVWPALRGFLAERLLEPGEGPRAHDLLDDRLGAFISDAACSALTRDDALHAIENTLLAMRLSAGRFGEPAVYVGTVRDAIGLPFRALRVIGLAEGHLPPATREDPVIPDVLRARLEAPALATAADRVLEALHALDAAVRNAGARVALSAPRLDIERSEREASSVILEAAAALGRPNAVTGERRATIPDTLAVRRDAFIPAHRAALQRRLYTPLGEAAWQDAVSLGAAGIPPRWCSTPALDLARIAALRSDEAPGPMDGLLPAEAASLSVPGLTREWPIWPSMLGTLLGCPHAFLLGNILGFKERVEAPSLREIGQPAYGSLFHRVAEQLYRAHGTALGAREGTLPGWLAQADRVVERAFDEFLEQYPLVGEAVRGRQRERLRQDVHELIEYEWTRGPLRRFVAVERGFGRPVPVELPLGARSLFVRGQIDRLDVEDGRTVVRDLKTGRAHPRVGKERDADPALDIQIAVYGMVARQLAREWGVPARIGAAYLYIGRGADQRDWQRDFDATLEPAAREWLDTAAALLDERAFPRTSNKADCVFCPFRPVCGDDGVYERAARVLASGGEALARLAALKGAGQEDDE